MILHTSVINGRIGVKVKIHLKKAQSQKAWMPYSSVQFMWEKFHAKNNPDAHVEEMPDLTKKENYQNVCIFRDITVSEKCPYEDGYLYQDLKSVGKEKETCFISPVPVVGWMPSGHFKLWREALG